MIHRQNKITATVIFCNYNPSVCLSLDVQAVSLTDRTDAALPVIEQCVGSRHNKCEL